MYTLTRQETAEKLSISTRSVDRYVKSGKLRSKKDGKIIYIHAADVANILGENVSSGPEVIIPKKETVKTESFSQENRAYTERKKTESNTQIMDAQSRATLEKIYLDLRGELKQKDKTIQDLSMRLGQAQEIAKNSVSLVEFKKSQFLLEESKGHLSGENENLKEKIGELGKKLSYEKTTNYILIAFCLILFIALGLLWFLRI